MAGNAYAHEVADVNVENGTWRIDLSVKFHNTSIPVDETVVVSVHVAQGALAATINTAFYDAIIARAEELWPSMNLSAADVIIHPVTRGLL